MAISLAHWEDQMIKINVSILYANSTWFIVTVRGKNRQTLLSYYFQRKWTIRRVFHYGNELSCGYICARTSGLPCEGGHGFAVYSLVPGMASLPLASLQDCMFKIWINTPPLKCTQSQQKAHIHCGQLFSSSNGRALLSLHNMWTKRWGPMNIYHWVKLFH